NLPEDFKTAMDLMITDRGGFIYEPVVGVHDKILEVDFTSLYPSIMVRYNISPETVKCPCCPDSKIRVPEIGYNICEKQIGLITKVLRPIIQRRMVYKRQARKGDLKCKERSDILKWLLVTCLDGETLVPYEQDGKVRIRPIAEIIDKYLPREGVLWVNDGLQVFGLTRGLAPAKIPVRGVFKFKSPRKILRLRLKQGHELWVTKDHPSYILERERLNVKRADELERGDYIPIMTERSRRGVLTFSRILSIEEVFPRMPFVYCFEVDQGLPGFLVEGNILTHNCFGFTGYKNARYGRIECHESITAYGREILLRSTEIAERHGYRVLHGIVDSLWLEGRGDQKALAEHLRNDIGIPVEIEGIYKWIVFLPCRTMQVGAMNRYYGLFENGKMKIRGVEARRNDSPEIVKRAQLEMLGILSKAENSYEFRRMIPEALGALRVWVDRVMDGDVDVNDLIFTTRISQELEGYAHFGNQVAALTQLKEYGVTVNPGEVVRYLLVDSESRDAFQRLRIAELVEDGDEYDRKKYAEHLLKAGESLFQPFGYDFERVKKECG
ncbi:MAG: DNA polymerase domain-containing protein, partial [Thermoplasmata archaeon]